MDEFFEVNSSTERDQDHSKCASMQFELSLLWFRSYIV